MNQWQPFRVYNKRGLYYITKKDIRNIQAVWVDVRFSLCFFDPSTRQFSKKQVPRIVSSFPVFQLSLQNWLSYARLTNAALPWRVAPWILETFFGVANWPTVMKLNLDTKIWTKELDYYHMFQYHFPRHFFGISVKFPGFKVVFSKCEILCIWDASFTTPRVVRVILGFVLSNPTWPRLLRKAGHLGCLKAQENHTYGSTNAGGCHCNFFCLHDLQCMSCLV